VSLPAAPAAAETATPAPADTAPAAPPAVSNDAPEVAKAATTDARGFWIQLGAFRQSAGAVEFQRKVAGELESLAPLLAIFKDQNVHRLQAGPYRTKADAASAAERIRSALQLVPVIVERR
jgi:rare lipoprotein A